MANNASPERIPLILTRPKPASDRFLAALSKDLKAGLLPIFSPLIDIVDLETPVEMTEQDAAIFTSVNGVQLAPDGQGRTAFCVGPATTQAAQHRGWTAIQSGADANSLVTRLVAEKPRQRIFHLAGTHTRGDVSGRLTQAGMNVHYISVYDQRLCDLTKTATRTLLGGNRAIVPLFSPRTATQFVAVAPLVTSVHVIALSAAVANALGSTQFASVTMAAHPNAQAMGAALDEVAKTT